MKNQRPVNLNLFTIRFPIPAIASILHRASGFVLFLSIPLILWALGESITSEQSFNNIHQTLTSPVSRFILWVLLSSFWMHFFAGIRHLLLDFNVGVELKSARLSAVLTLAIATLFIILTGMWLW